MKQKMIRYTVKGDHAAEKSATSPRSSNSSQFRNGRVVLGLSVRRIIRSLVPLPAVSADVALAQA
jgi:hypothetical protein